MLLDPNNTKPLRDQVLLEREESSGTLGSGILIAPQTQLNKSLYCTVLAVGPGRFVEGKYIPMEVKVGDRVLIRQWSGSNATKTIEGKEVFFAQQELIECIWEEDV